jgi:DNA-binding NarL/FixJ family response regulator
MRSQGRQVNRHHRGSVAAGLARAADRQQPQVPGRGGRPAPRAPDPLAPQELHIARLAAEGLSNREIGQQLYLSHRTVRNHVYGIFRKLGITSRAELAAAVGLPRPGVGPPGSDVAA